ncbi:MAG TPA: HNH endonuclease [Candidatus Eisenbacteria bacterium]|nr:HNH endonuclease [Candidatus Eisenbacteria bacterium]
MKGYVALTDFEWFSFLRDHSESGETNFWQPRGGALLDPPEGMPFFFKLDAEHGSWIAGFAFFAWRSMLPAWLAWDTYESANGAGNRDDFLRMLARRRGESIDPTGSFQIGCLLLTDATFFSEQDWIRPPSDWARTGIQRGKYYDDLSQGEGRRVFEECLARRTSATLPAVAPDLPIEQAGERYTQYLARARKGQRAFQIKVLDAYGRSCAVTTEHSLPVLDAAHIQPYAEGGDHSVGNGILLRADIHRLFDKGLVTITQDYKFRVSKSLESVYKNGRAYYELEEASLRDGIHLPRDARHYPNRDLLAWHGKKFVA